MEIKLSDRDKKLLLFLAIFLMAVGFGKLVILPGIKNYQKLDMEITDRQLEKDEMEMTIIGYPMLEGEYEELKAQADEVYEDYYPVMNSQEIDRRITGIVLEAGVEAVSLQIDMADQQGLSLGKYDGLEVMLQGEGSEETEASPDGEEAQESSQETEERIPPGIESAKVVLTAEGQRDRLNQLLDVFITDRPGIHVNSYSFSQRVSQDRGAVVSLTMEMYIYMFDKENLN